MGTCAKVSVRNHAEMCVVVLNSTLKTVQNHAENFAVVLDMALIRMTCFMSVA
jgi:hypothetical protein